MEGNCRKCLLKWSLAAVLITLVTAQCPDGYDSFSDNCYRFVDQPADFTSASQDCRNAGGSIAQVSDENIQDFVETTIERENWETLWIGAQEQRIDWRWVDGVYLRAQGCYLDSANSPLLPDFVEKSEGMTPDECDQRCSDDGKRYSGVRLVNERGVELVVCRCGNEFNPSEAGTVACHTPCPANSSLVCGNADSNGLLVRRLDGDSVDEWYRDQPNNYDDYQECMALHNGHNFKFGDESCGNFPDEYSHICGYDLRPSACYDSKSYTEDQCYSLHLNSGLTWFKAQEDCIRRGGHLIRIQSRAFIEKIAVDETVRDSGKKWWVGATNRRWTWSSGAEIEYSNWAGERPHKWDNECVHIKRDTGPRRYMWEDIQCSEQHRYVCQQVPSTTTKAATTKATTTKATTTKSATPSQGTVPPRGSTVPRGSSPTRGGSATAPVPTSPGQNTGGQDDDEGMPTGVIVAIVLAGVAALVATLRLVVYCCQKSRTSTDDKKPLA